MLLYHDHFYFIIIIFYLFIFIYLLLFEDNFKNMRPGGLIFGGAIAKGILRYEFGGLWRGLYMNGVIVAEFL